MIDENVVLTSCRDDNQNPTGGSVKGLGIDIKWQDGALGTGQNRKEPNGAFLETVIACCISRLEFFQNSKFRCLDNMLAIEHLTNALDALDRRTKKRLKNGTEGTYNV